MYALQRFNWDVLCTGAGTGVDECVCVCVCERPGLARANGLLECRVND